MQHPGHSVTGLAAVLSARGVPGFPWLLMSSAILVLAAGALLLFRPTEGVKSLTVLLMIYFLADALTSIMTAIEYRLALPGVWGWGIVVGLLDIALATLLLVGWPGTADWAIGLLAGINLIANDVMLVMIGSAARNPVTA